VTTGQATESDPELHRPSKVEAIIVNPVDTDVTPGITKLVTAATSR